MRSRENHSGLTWSLVRPKGVKGPYLEKQKNCMISVPRTGIIRKAQLGTILTGAKLATEKRHRRPRMSFLNSMQPNPDALDPTVTASTSDKSCQLNRPVQHYLNC